MLKEMKSALGGKSLKKGFTLIELLVVIAIIAILATIVILNVSAARVKAADAKAKDDTNEATKIANLCTSDGSGTLDTDYSAGVAICSGANATATGNFPLTSPTGWDYTNAAVNGGPATTAPTGYMNATSGDATDFKSITCLTTGCTPIGGGKYADETKWY